MTARQLQDGADWLYRQFYRLDRIIVRTIRAVFTVGLMAAYLSFRLSMTYRYDNRREGIVGKNPALADHVICQTAIRSTSPKPLWAVNTAAGSKPQCVRQCSQRGSPPWPSRLQSVEATNSR